MLCTNAYPKDSVEECRGRVDAQLAAYQAVVATAGKKAVKDFEHTFFSNLLLTLETYFTHRSRQIEGKEGNALNEVRILCNSMTSNDDVFSLRGKHADWHATLKSDKSILYKAETSVLGYKVGDPISLDAEQFTKLSDAYFAAIEEKFTE